MKRSTALLLTAVAIALFALQACSSDDPVTYEHFYNPMWSPDGGTIVAGYVSGTVAEDGTLSGPGSPSQPGTHLAVVDVSTRAMRVIDLVNIQTQHAMYAFDPSGSVLAMLHDGQLSLIDLFGTVRGTYTAPGQIKLTAAEFMSDNGSVLFCAGAASSLFEVRRLVFDPSTWKVIDDSILVSGSASGTILSITPTGRNAFAIRFGNGDVRQYGTNGTLMQSYTSVPFTSANPWHQRLIYYQRPIFDPGIYMLEKDAIVFLDLTTGEKKTLVTGDIIDLDVSDDRNSMVYETKTGDIWLASSTGLPLSRIAPQNLMPRFSADGKGLATVERLNKNTDSLRVLRFF